MEWIEFVHIRSYPDNTDSNLALLQSQAESCQSEHLLSIQVLRHAVYPGDAAIVFCWSSALPPAKTPSGIAIADLLGRYGTVEHGVWLSFSIHKAHKEA